ncbi:hypothetical protein ACET3Z_020071 [Daucus carota]
MINWSSSDLYRRGRKRNKENQSDGSLADVGNSHSPLSNSRRYSLVAETCESDYALKATGRVLLSTVDQNASNQSIRRSPLSNIDQNANPGFCVGFYRHSCCTSHYTNR